MFWDRIYLSIYFSHILKVPFEGSEGSGIVYIWIGSKTTQEEAIHAEQMGRSMFEVFRQYLLFLFVCLCLFAFFFKLSFY